MLLIYILGTPLDEMVFPDQSHTQYLGQIIQHIRWTSKHVTLVIIQCCFYAGLASMKCPISDNICSLAASDHVRTLCLVLVSLSGCTVELRFDLQLPCKAKRQHLLTLQVSRHCLCTADNVLQSVVVGGAFRGLPTMPSVASPHLLYLRLCNRLQCDISWLLTVD